VKIGRRGTGTRVEVKNGDEFNNHCRGDVIEEQGVATAGSLDPHEQGERQLFWSSRQDRERARAKFEKPHRRVPNDRA